jgi:hypothetical protein
MGVFHQPADMADSYNEKPLRLARFKLVVAAKDGATSTTVDHADIRGLGTACLVFVAELPLARAGSSAVA